MRLTHLILALTLTAPMAMAVPIDDGEIFDALTQGKTIYFRSEGELYGAEQYLPDRRVIWSFMDGECSEGRWFARAGRICFVYEHDPLNQQCWIFDQGASGLRAEFDAPYGQGRVLEQMGVSDKPLTCGTPWTGV